MSNNQCIIWNTYHRYETAGQCNIEDKHCITDSAGRDIHDTLYVVCTQYATDHNNKKTYEHMYHEAMGEIGIDLGLIPFGQRVGYKALCTIQHGIVKEHHGHHDAANDIIYTVINET